MIEYNFKKGDLVKFAPKCERFYIKEPQDDIGVVVDAEPRGERRGHSVIVYWSARQEEIETIIWHLSPFALNERGRSCILKKEP